MTDLSLLFVLILFFFLSLSFFSFLLLFFLLSFSYFLLLYSCLFYSELLVYGLGLCLNVFTRVAAEVEVELDLRLCA